MGSFRRRRESRLEERLRTGRPAPSEEFVRMLAARVRESARAPGRSVAPKIAVAAILTALLLAAVAAAGGAGQAASSLHDIGTAVTKLVSTRHASTPAAASAAASVAQASGSAVAAGSSAARFASSPVGATKIYSFRDQYGVKLPLCHDGHTLYLPIPEWIAHILRGDRPGPCPEKKKHDHDRDDGKHHDNDNDEGKGND